MAVGMHQLHVVRRVRTAPAAPDPMVDLAVFLCDAQGLTADRTSSPCPPCPYRPGCARSDGGSGSLPLRCAGVDRRSDIVPFVPSIGIRSDCGLSAFGPVASPAVLPGTVPTSDRKG